jgi:hypothetical protein
MIKRKRRKDKNMKKKNQEKIEEKKENTSLPKLKKNSPT